ncbi:MAG: hypothetical protein QOG91_473 [Candidatus Parcubacteria bacterium]|jgi:hypothetical protein|nr:hypothetical protein [Candidatus Parcubacteria bacterium]
MFTLLTVRGLPLHQIGKSGFFPALDAFDPHQTEQRMSIACNTLSLSVASLLLVLMLVAGSQSYGTDFLLFILSTGIGLLSCIFSIVDGEFAGQLRDLDKLLVKAGKPGLPALPATGSQITEYLEEVCITTAGMILYYDRISLFHENGRRHRLLLEQFIAVCSKLKFVLGNRDQFVARARLERRLTEEKQNQLAEKKAAQAEQMTAAVEQAMTLA